MKRKIALSCLLALVAMALVAVPVFAIIYRATYTVTENTTATSDYDMLALMAVSNNDWMAANGFMNSSANDTRIETLGGLRKPHMVTDNMTMTAVPVPVSSQTNLYFTTGNSELDDFYIIAGYAGYVEVDDNPWLEIGDNFTIEQTGWVDTDNGSGKNLVYKEGAFQTYVSGTENITSSILSLTALDFVRANSDWVSIPDHADFSFTSGGGNDDPFSVIVWVNFDDATSSTLVCKLTAAGDAREWRLHTTVGDDLELQCFKNDDGNVFIGELTDVAITGYQGAWIQVAATYDGTGASAGMTLYINGSPVASSSNDGGAYAGMTGTTAIVELGSTSGGTADYLDGIMGGAKIYSAELSAADIATDFVGGHRVADLVAWYKLIDGAGNPADSSGNGHNATANLADWIVSTLARAKVSVTATGVSSGEHTVSTNFTSNLFAYGSFEVGNPPTGWTKSGDVTRSNVQAKIGTYSVRLATVNAWCKQTQPVHTSYQGANVTFGGWAYAANASHIRIRIYDGISFATSSFHSGVPGWEWLEITRLLDAGATELSPFVEVKLAVAAYFDGAVLVPGYSLSEGGNLVISIDGTEIGAWTDNATYVSVPDTSANWTFFENNVMPYCDNMTISVNGTQQLYFNPTSMIIGTNLPDRATSATNNGTFVWGSNPEGVSVVLGSLVSSAQPIPGVSIEPPVQDITPEVEVTDWFIEPDVSGTLKTNPLRPFVIIMSDTTTLTELQAWRILALAFILFVTVLTAKNVRGHQGITAIVAGAATGLMVALTIFPMWALVFTVGAVIGGLISERSPSL